MEMKKLLNDKKILLFQSRLGGSKIAINRSIELIYTPNIKLMYKLITFRKNKEYTLSLLNKHKLGPK